MSACSNKCKKFKHAVWEVKVNERTNKVLLDSISTYDGGLLTRKILKKEQDEEIRGPAATMYKTYEFEIFDKDNWSYKIFQYWQKKGKSIPEKDYEGWIYMRDGQLFDLVKFSNSLPNNLRYKCSK
ncbi:hypothetical protein N9O44_00840 [Gammaproteobacteria bacterium]|nr:hypothetical protein [Gammaproteobacteria bacterium]